MGSLGLYLIVYMVKCVSIVILIISTPHLIYFRKNKRVKKFHSWLKKDTFFNQIFSILIESYFEFLIAAHFHLTYSGTFIN